MINEGLTFLSKVPGKAATLSLSLNGVPIEKDALYQSLSLRSLPDPQ